MQNIELALIHYIFNSDRLFRTMTDIIVAEGYAAAGYEYINVDDCWPERERDPRGRLVPDRERFPYGMKSLSDYVSIFSYLNIISIILVMLQFLSKYYN